MTLQQALNSASNRILRRDAELLLAHVLQQDRTWLFLHAQNDFDGSERARFEALVTRRAAHEPLQYLTGTQEFFGLPLHVSTATLIPRPETEHLVEAVLAWASAQPAELRILDVGTGTGAIALALATHLPSARMEACDLSPTALEVAAANARNLGLAGRIDLRHSDLLAAFLPALETDGRFDVIVSNPPYIPIGDAAAMQPEVRDHEPHSALFAGEDGLEVYRRLIPQARMALVPGGLLAMEIGFGQREALAELLSDWSSVRFISDYAGIPRVALAERPAI